MSEKEKEKRLNPSPQLDAMNFLFDLRKIICEITIFNKDRNPTFFNEIKNLLNENLNSVYSNNYTNDRKIFYMKYIEKGIRDMDEQKDFVLTQKIGLYIYLAIYSSNLKEDYITNFKNQIKELSETEKVPLNSRSILFFFYENEEIENFEKNEEYTKNNIYFIKTNYKNFDQNIKISTENQLYPIIRRAILNGNNPYLFSREKLSDKMRYNKNTLENIKEYVGGLIQLQDLGEAMKFVDRCISEFSFSEKGRWEDVKALLIFYKDFTDNGGNKGMKFNEKIIELMEDAKIRYQREKITIMVIYNLYRQINYYMNFMNEKWYAYHQCLIQLNIQLRYFKAQSFEEFFIHYLRISKLYMKLKFKRTASVFFLFAGLTCFKNDELKKMLPYIINKLKNMFDLCDVSKNIIDSEEEFNSIHKCLVLNQRKPISFFVKTLDENNKIKYEQTYKKKIEAKKILSIKSNLGSISKYIFKLFWKEIYQFLNTNIMTFFKEKKDFENCLIFSLGYLQSSTEIINATEQKSIMNFNIKNSLLSQTKIFLNITKLPLLMRIIPITSNIRFDVSSNPNKSEESDVFLYNPWEENKLTSNVYYWTTNSYQQIKIQLYNPLDIELEINKIRILFKGAQPTVYPSRVNIPPKTSTYIFSKIHPDTEGTTTIIGIKYEIINTVGIQYVDDNGNGLFYNYENIYFDPTKGFVTTLGAKQQLISLSNIKIYPEIPKLTFKLLDDEFMDRNLNLFDNQLYNFRFKFDNIGRYDVDKLTCYIYVYKANNYKITLDELNIKTNIKKNGGSYNLNYVYWHKNAYEKIEFKIYYFSKEKDAKSNLENEVIIKQYLYYCNNIQTFRTFNFSSISIKPMVMSSDINELALIDKTITLNYTAFFCSNKNYIGFLVENIHESRLQIDVFDESREEIIQNEIIDGMKAKEISTEIIADSNLKNIVLKWNLIDLYNCEGKILLSDIIPYYDINMWKKFSFFLNCVKFKDENNLNCYKCFFRIKNNQKLNHNNLKFQIYIYQTLSNNELQPYIYNRYLENKLFIEGSLSYNIDTLESEKEFNHFIKLFPLDKEEFNISCILLDKEKKEVYFSPVTVNFKS